MHSSSKTTGEIKDNKRLQFYKHRNIMSCISDGISLCTDWLKEFVPTTIIPVTVSSVFFSLVVVGVIFIGKSTSHSFTTNANTWYAYIVLAAILIVSILISSMSFASTYTYFEMKSVKKTKYNINFFYQKIFKKTPFLASMFLIFAILLTFVFVAIQYILSIDFGEDIKGDILNYFCAACFLLAMVYVALPLRIVLPSLIYSKGNISKRFIEGYKLGMSIWSKVFTQSIIVVVIKIIIGGVIMIPFITCALTYISYVNGIHNGDSVHITNGFIIYFAIISFVTAICITYFVSMLNMSYLYLYSSAVSDRFEMEKNNIEII